MREGWKSRLLAVLAVGGVAACRAPAPLPPEQLADELAWTHPPSPNPVQPPPAVAQPPAAPSAQQLGRQLPNAQLAMNPSWPSPFQLVPPPVRLSPEAAQQGAQLGVGGAGGAGQGQQQRQQQGMEGARRGTPLTPEQRKQQLFDPVPSAEVDPAQENAPRK